MAEGKPAVLFLCSANTCRSQMAEAFLRKHAGDRFVAHGAGLAPGEDIHPLARRAMAEVGLDMAGQRPKAAGEYLGRRAFRYVVIVCDRAASRCPSSWPGVTERLFWPFEDPAALEGTEEERLARFREVRDLIEAKVLSWLRDAG